MKKLLLTVLAALVFVLGAFSLASCKEDKKASVVYMSNGRMHATVETDGNAIIPLPPEPSFSGYTFGGWFYDENLWDEPFDNKKWESIPLMGNVTVYAKWKPTTPCEQHTPRDFTILEQPTCAKDGLKQTVCRLCDETYTEAIPSLPHTPADAAVRENFVDSTCALEGSYDEVVYCLVCEGVASRTNKSVEKKEHTPADDFIKGNIVEPTCAHEGSYDEIYLCTVCGEAARTDKKTVEKLPHTPSDTALRENEIPSTCAKEGSYDMVIRCTVCKELLSAETHSLPLEDHTETIPCGVCGLSDFLTYEYVADGDYYVVTGATAKNFSQIEIPAKYKGKPVKRIAEGAFSGFTSLKKVIINVSLVSVEKNAFSGCTALTEVVYMGTKNEWGMITVAEGNDALIDAEKEYESNRTEWMPFQAI